MTMPIQASLNITSIFRWDSPDQKHSHLTVRVILTLDDTVPLNHYNTGFSGYIIFKK